MNRLSLEKRSQILHLLVEGNSIRATARIADAAKNTVTKLLRDVGVKCLEYQDEVLRDLPCRKIQCDEIWSFCYAKEKNVPEAKRGQFGYRNIWTWTALCADTKLVPCWHVGRRSAADAKMFICDLASRLSNRVQLTTDGYKAYLEAVEAAFGGDVDYGVLVKMYGAPKENERRYSPAECIGSEKRIIVGNPERKDISTSYVERQNLSMRMNMRRFTRLTNAFSKKVENLICAVSLHYMYYNFVRIHQSLRITPAMAAGVSNRLWNLNDVAALDS
jgi:IS1 family transposase